jgi:hypothetical protein
VSSNLTSTALSPGESSRVTPGDGFVDAVGTALLRRRTHLFEWQSGLLLRRLDPRAGGRTLYSSRTEGLNPSSFTSSSELLTPTKSRARAKPRRPRKPPVLKILPSGYAVLVYSSGKRRHEHRMVFFKAAGKGPYACHWCGKAVLRMRGIRYHPDKLVVDHLNTIRHDNRPENLVAACTLCNVTRTAMTKPFRKVRAKV